MKKTILALTIVALTVPIVLAHVGVGISAPRFNLGELKPKQYDIGIINVFNAGDQYGCFKMNISYLQDQPEHRVPQDWVVFSPSEFCLEPNFTEHQFVNVSLDINPSTRLQKKLKGDYFSFIEACTYGGGNVGACAAAKLYFTL